MQLSLSRWTSLLLVAGLIGGGAALLAAEPPVIEKWSVSPASEPVPVLQYRLLPRLLDQTPGDAAARHVELQTRLSADEISAIHKLADKCKELPASKLPQAELAKLLEQHKTLLAELHQVARLQQCDWKLPVSKLAHSLADFDELTSIRKHIALLELDVRWRVSQADFVGAHHSLQSCFAIGKQVSQGTTLMHAIVASAIYRTAFSGIECWIQQPGSPSLYWALTALPQPLIDIGPAMDAELTGFMFHHPALAAWARNQPLDLDAERAAGEALNGVLLAQAGEKQTDARRIGMMATTMLKYPTARAWFKKQGRSEADLDELGPNAVVGLYHLRTFREMSEDGFKWFLLPAHERGAIPKDLARRIVVVAKQRDLPLPAMLVQLNESACEHLFQLDRMVVLLRTVEALRLHAKTHENAWPATLAELKPIPVPKDPITAAPLAYEVDGKTAVLSLPQIDDYRAVRILRLTVAK